jgi:hypothetical protein
VDGFSARHRRVACGKCRCGTRSCLEAGARRGVAAGRPLVLGGTPEPSATEGRVIGVKDGQALAWNIARARGLGLIGPGALDAVRALLVAMLAEPRQSSAGAVEILIPASDARTLIGEHTGPLDDSGCIR